MKALILIFALVFIPLSMSAQYADAYVCAHVGPECETEKKKPDPLIYPNPNTGFFTVESQNTEGVLYNTHGQFLRRVEIGKEINISDLPQGCYFLRLDNIVFKIIKL
jgi:Secretion system C-terminal sorting domain